MVETLERIADAARMWGSGSSQQSQQLDKRTPLTYKGSLLA